MIKKLIKSNSLEKSKWEHKFTPRIINPVKIVNAVIFSADEQVRNGRRVLEENMPWINTSVLYDPISVSNYKSDQATVLIFDDTAMTFVDSEKICQNNTDVVQVLLSSNDFIHRSPPFAF